MTATTTSDKFSSKHSSDQDNHTPQRLSQETNSYHGKELDHPQHEIIAGIDTERDIENDLEHEKPISHETKDPNLITWDSVDDPANPRNWSFKRKWAAVFVVSSFTFISPVSSSMVAPALGIMKTHLKISGDFEAAMILSIFVLSYAIGPLIFGPLSEIYGRVRVLQYSNLIYLIFNFVCGFAKNGPQMLAFRFFAGFGNSFQSSLSSLHLLIRRRWKCCSCTRRWNTFGHFRR